MDPIIGEQIDRTDLILKVLLNSLKDLQTVHYAASNTNEMFAKLLYSLRVNGELTEFKRIPCRQDLLEARRILTLRDNVPSPVPDISSKTDLAETTEEKRAHTMIVSRSNIPKLETSRTHTRFDPDASTGTLVLHTMVGNALQSRETEIQKQREPDPLNEEVEVSPLASISKENHDGRKMNALLKERRSTLARIEAVNRRKKRLSIANFKPASEVKPVAAHYDIQALLRLPLGQVTTILGPYSRLHPPTQISVPHGDM